MWSLGQTQLKVGSWQIHNSYGKTSRVTQSRDKVYGLADGSLFSVDKGTDEIRTLNKVTGLNSSTVTAIAWDEFDGLLLVGYEDGNVDFVDEESGVVTNMPDLKESSVTSSKTVNDVFVTETGDVYVACDVGILKLNVGKVEIADTYMPGKTSGVTKAMKRVYVHDGNVYALSDDALYIGLQADVMLVDPSHWTKKTFNESPVLPSLSEVTDGDGNLWKAEGENGLTRYGSNGEKLGAYLPDGPAKNTIFTVHCEQGRLYALTGHSRTYDAGDTDVEGCVMVMEDGKWKNFTEKDLTEKTNKPFRTLCYIAVDKNDKSHFFVSSTRYGVYEFRNDTFYTRYNERGTSIGSGCTENLINATASTLEVASSVRTNADISPCMDNYITVTGVALDNNGNLWVANEMTTNYLKVRGANGNWYAYAYSGMSNPGMLDKMMVTGNGLKLVASARNPGGLLVVKDEGNATSFASHKSRYISTLYDQDGNSVSLNPLSMAEDRNGDIWIGSWDNGVMVLRNTENIFSSSYRMYRPKINRADGSGYADYLFAQQRITAIAVDGGNRKWVGTSGYGLYVLSEDGMQTIMHFTSKNSPLVSDNISSLAFNDETGEIFIATDGGLCSYRSDATEGESSLKSSKLKVFPNPVRPEYVGYVTVDGLVDNSLVKVTDASGNVVYETRSNGGTATWNLRTVNGKEVGAGVYYVMASVVKSEGESESAIGKLLIIK